jgi:hypothetical protein
MLVITVDIDLKGVGEERPPDGINLLILYINMQALIYFVKDYSTYSREISETN